MGRHNIHASKGLGPADRKGITIIKPLLKFPDGGTAQTWFEGIRWKDGPPADCGWDNYGHCLSHPSMPKTCMSCRKRYSVRKGTIM